MLIVVCRLNSFAPTQRTLLSGESQSKTPHRSQLAKMDLFMTLFNQAGTEDGLASIIGHEMSHQILRHSGERMSTAKLTQLLVFFLSLFGVDYSLGNTALTFLMSLPNSRAQEAEADHVGLLLSSGACYKPEESVQVWKRFQQSEKAGQVPGFLSTHPTHANRIEALQGEPSSPLVSEHAEAAPKRHI